MKLSEDWGQVLAVVGGGLGIVYAVMYSELLVGILSIVVVIAAARIQQLVRQVRELQS